MGRARGFLAASASVFSAAAANSLKIDCIAMIEKTYQPADIEDRISSAWEAAGAREVNTTGTSKAQIKPDVMAE